MSDLNELHTNKESVFCLTRVIATCLRIAWACHPTDIHVGIAATVFVYAGIVLLYLANLFFAQRIVRAQHPPFGWSKPFTMLFPVTFIVTIGTVLCLVAAVIVSFYTLDSYSRHAAREIQRYGATMVAIVAFLPFAIVGISSLARRHPTIRRTKTTDKFGEGSMRAKVVICLLSAALLCLGASFRAGTILTSPVPIQTSTNPPRPAPVPGYLSKACFYIFNFTIEVCVCLVWLGLRIDNRFHVPDGAKGAFSYAGGFVFAGEPGNEKKRASNLPNSQQALARPSSFRLSSTSLQARERSSQRPVSISSRVSWPGSHTSKIIEQTKIANRVSWGGVSREDVQAGVGEDKREIPYPAFDLNGRYGAEAGDVAIDGVEKEMGWDPKSGQWAVRPVSTVSAVSPTMEME